MFTSEITPEPTTPKASHEECNSRFLLVTEREIREAVALIRADLANKRACSISGTTYDMVSWIEDNLALPNGAQTSNARIKNRADRIPERLDIKSTPIGKFVTRVRQFTPPLPYKGFKNDNGKFGLERTDIPVLDTLTTLQISVRKEILEVLKILDIPGSDTEQLQNMLHAYAPTELHIDANTLQLVQESISKFARITCRNGLYLPHAHDEAPSLVKKAPRETIPPTRQHPTLRPSFSAGMTLQPERRQYIDVSEVEEKDYLALAKQMLTALSNTTTTIHERKKHFLTAMNELTVTLHSAVYTPKRAAQKLLNALVTLQRADHERWEECRLDLISRLNSALDENNDGGYLSIEARARLLDPPAIVDGGREFHISAKTNQSIPLPR